MASRDLLDRGVLISRTPLFDGAIMMMNSHFEVIFRGEFTTPCYISGKKTNGNRTNQSRSHAQ